jgi:hypothetical protein
VATHPSAPPEGGTTGKTGPGRSTLRRILLVALTGTVGLLSWRYPTLVNPTAVAVGVFAVLDRLGGGAG